MTVFTKWMQSFLFNFDRSRKKSTVKEILISQLLAGLIYRH